MPENQASGQIAHEDFVEACKLADTRMKQRNGHQFMHILKTRCQFCGRSPNQKGKCPHWFQTFLAELSGELTGVYGL